MAPDSFELASSATARLGEELAANRLECVGCKADIRPAATDLSGGRDADTPIKTDLPSPTMHAATTASWDSTQTDSAATSSPVTAAATTFQSVRRLVNRNLHNSRLFYLAPPFSSQTPCNALQALPSVLEFETRLEDVELCRRKDGTLWKLGGGSFGAGELRQPTDPAPEPWSCDHHASQWLTADCGALQCIKL